MRNVSLEQAGAVILVLAAGGLAIVSPRGSTIPLDRLSGSSAASADPRLSITPLELAREIAEGKNPVVLDTRPAMGYNAYHIPGARPPAARGALGILPADTVGRRIVVCSSDEESGVRTADRLREKALDVRTLRGGMAAWWRDIMTPPELSPSAGKVATDEIRARIGVRDYFLRLERGDSTAKPPTVWPSEPHPCPRRPRRTILSSSYLHGAEYANCENTS